MGRAISALVDHELATVLGELNSVSGSWFEDQAQRRLAEREAALTEREREVAEAEDRARRRSEHLRVREREMQAREWRLELAEKLASQPTRSTQANTGRNELCPCGSGIKYKKCHGEISDRQ